MIARYTTLGLTAENTELLQQLVQINIDSRDSYREAADRTNDQRLQAAFLRIAQERNDHARALQSILWSNFKAAGETRSLMSSVHGVWVNLRATFEGTPTALLEEALKIEEHVSQRYREAMDAASGRAIRQLLQEQFDAVSVASENIRVLQEIWPQAKG